MTPFPSSLPYASTHQYSPRGKNDLSLASKSIIGHLKVEGFHYDSTGKALSVITGMVETVVAKRNEFAFLNAYLGPSTLLVPMPGHAPMKSERDAIWASRGICRELQAKGIVTSFETILRRKFAINKASVSKIEGVKCYIIFNKIS